MDSRSPSLGTRHHVLALHAFGLDSRSFDALRSELGQQCELMALDHIGHAHLFGRTSSHLHDYVEAAVAAIDSHGAPLLHLVGHSFGGVVAALAAAGRRRRVASLTLLATPAAGGAVFQERARDSLRMNSSERVESTMSRWFTPELEARHSSIALYARSKLSSQSAQAAACTWEALAEFAGFEAIGDLPATLCLAAEDDRSTPPAVMRRIVDAVGARLLVLQEGGHLFPLTEPRATAACLLEHWTQHARIDPAWKGNA